MALRSHSGSNSALALAPLVLLSCVIASIAPRVGAASVTCNRVAAPYGSDAARGTIARPFRSVQRLVDSLRPGQTGCLRSGTYGGPGTVTDFAAPRITIRSFPLEHATIGGWPSVNAPGVTLADLSFDLNDARDGSAHCGSNAAFSLEINADNVTLSNDNIYQSDVPRSERSVAIGIGWSGSADHAVIRGNWIHDFGSCRDLDHGIYVSNSTGTQIYGNRFWNGPHGWAVHLYPSAHHTHVFNNVVDRVGSGFAVGGGTSDPSSYNEIDHNVVMNSTGLPSAGLSRGVAMSAWWGSQPGPGNAFFDNVSINNPGGIFRGWGVSVHNNRTG